MAFKHNRRYATFEQDRSEFNEYCKEIEAENRRLLEADSQSESQCLMKVDSIYRDHDGNLWRVVRRWPERIHNHETLEEDFAAQLTSSKHWELFDNAGQAKFSDTKLILLQPRGEQ